MKMCGNDDISVIFIAFMSQLLSLLPDDIQNCVNFVLIGWLCAVQENCR
jgi:hypothetical protein